VSAGIVSIVLLLLKKKERRSTFVFGPFIVMGTFFHLSFWLGAIGMVPEHFASCMSEKTWVLNQETLDELSKRVKELRGLCM